MRVGAPVKVIFEGETVDADELTFVVGAGEFAGRSDSTTLIKLSDGATLEFKHKVRHVYRLRDRLCDKGRPIYLMHGSLAMNKIGAPGTAHADSASLNTSTESKQK